MKMLSPLGWVYNKATQFRNLFYDRGWIESHGFDIPVVSVGNITVGGTGKTPVIDQLVTWAKEKGLKPAIISRGYRGQVNDVAEVQLNDLSAQVYGDEPTLLKTLHPQIPVYVGSQKVDVVRRLLQEHDVQIIFADDAFQHRKLKRHLDLVVIDATEPLQNYKPLPWGRAREEISSLKRSQYILLSRANLTSKVNKDKLIEFLFEEAGGEIPPIVQLNYIFKKEDRPMGDILLISGIGRPKSFVKMFLYDGVNVRDHLEFMDHHSYTQEDALNILKKAEALRVEKIVTTEKDMVKLKQFPELETKLIAMPLQIQFEEGIEQLYGRILQMVN